LTTVFETPAPFLRAAAASVFAQTAPEFEWIVLDNGSTSPDVVAAISELASDRRVRLMRVERNVGILAGMRMCLEAATGEYVIPFDADDVLVDDALETLTDEIASHELPAFLYSDEDMLVDDVPTSPYLRPDWDPVLNLCTSYAFHLCAFRRERALELGVYTDSHLEWCHDWDTITRFADSGHRPVHISEMLYHWRTHRGSTTNRPRPNEGSLGSQRQLLMRALADRGMTDLFEIAPFPLNRGAPEWWLRRRSILLPSIGIVRVTRDSASSRREEFAGIGAVEVVKDGEGDVLQALRQRSLMLGAEFTVVCSDSVEPEGRDWIWEAVGLAQLHQDVVLVAGRIVDYERRVLAGPQILGFDGLSGCPDRGRPETDPGYFALALKQRSISAAHSAFFIARTQFLVDALGGLPAQASFSFLGSWLGARAFEQALRVASSPLVQAVARPGFDPAPEPSGPERAAFTETFGSLLPDVRWYSQHFERSLEKAYQLSVPAAA
jgi:glycosyltransferase involved in cell wall biosynthesis